MLKRKNILTFLCCLIFVLVILIIVVPITSMFLTSFKPRKVATASPPVWVFRPTLDNYKNIIEEDMFKYFKNSVIIALGCTALVVSIGSLAAYSLARFRIRHSKDIAFYILSMRMLPPIAVALPFFLLARKIGLMDTHIAVIMAHATFTLPLTVWLMRGYIMGVPRELEEAGLIDGCSILGAIRYITLPLVAPGMAATAIFCFLMSWNEFLFVVVLTGVQTKTLPVLVTGYVTRIGIMWGRVFAMAVVITLPVLLFTFFIQKHLVRGVTFGLMKSEEN